MAAKPADNTLSPVFAVFNDFDTGAQALATATRVQKYIYYGHIYPLDPVIHGNLKIFRANIYI